MASATQAHQASEREFCEGMLPKVSRTFAVCIRLLPDDLEHAVLVAYLLCRVADTIEDSPYLEPCERTRLLEAFGRCLDPEGADAALLRDTFESVSSDEELLAREADTVLAEFRRLPVEPTVIHLTGGLSRAPSWCQTIADVFEVETVPVAGEGAALGAAIHAAWVWGREHGGAASLAEIAEPFVVLNERRRARPRARYAESCRMQQRLYVALSERARGIATRDDPFELRARLTALVEATR